MDKNIRTIFFVATLLILMLCVTSISATDVSNNTDTATSVEDNQGIDEVSTLDTSIVESTHTKNIKTEEQSTDYYVSDTSGSDDNIGTNDSPFKTIQKALNQTTSEDTYNIYILEGTYKGLGNTNLTVNGNHTINMIGTGMNNTVLDGEAQYVINPNPGYVWGSSEIWYPYINDSGNYAMTITSGSGHISINNLTITHMWCPGGDRIDLYDHSPVDNYGNLSVNYVDFYYNCGGVGSAIRNNNGATILINNSQFEENRKSSSTGNDGIIYNIGNATVLNTIFNHNYARWGTILNDKNITIVNCTFSNNIAYDGGSTYKYGAGFAFNSGNSDFFNPTSHATVNYVFNCTFINNGQTDIYGLSGTLNASNNQFINSTGIRINEGNNYIIANNTITGTVPSTITESLSTGASTVSIESTANFIVIENNTIEMDDGIGISIKNGNLTNNKITIKNESASLIISGGNNSYVLNNTFNQAINITANNTCIQNNTITTPSEYAISLYSRSKNITITDNYLKARLFIGDMAVKNPNNNVVENNTPKVSGNIYVRNDITEASEGSMLNPTTLPDAISKVKNNESIVLINGEYNITDTLEISEDTTLPETTTFNIIGLNDAITNDVENTIINGQKTQILRIHSGYDIKIINITFINSSADKGGAIYSESNLTVENSEFIDNTATTGAAIYATGDINIKLNNNTFINNTAEVETIYLNNTTTKNISNNIYHNNSILTTTTISFANDELSPQLSEEIPILINEITLTNPEFYDNNITSLEIYEYLNDEVVEVLENTMNYNISSIYPTTLYTYVVPSFTTDKSNTLTVEVKASGLSVNIDAPTTSGFISETTDIKITLTDESNSLVQKGIVKIYENNNLLATLNVANGKVTYTTDTLETTGVRELFIEYEDSTGIYNKANQTTQLITFDQIYVDPNVTENHSGLIDDPTTIQDALNKIHNNKTIILLDGTYNLSKAISISSSTTKAKRFNITTLNNNAIITTQDNNQMMKISSGYNIKINNIKFANGKSFNGALSISRSTVEFNNCKFINNNGTDMNYMDAENNIGGALYVLTSNITLKDCIFENNSANFGGSIYFYNTNSTIINTTFDNDYSRAAAASIYLRNSNLYINDSIFSNSFSVWGGTAIYGGNTPVNLTINNCTFKNILLPLTGFTNTSIPLRHPVISDFNGNGNLSLTNSHFINLTNIRTGAVNFDGININIINNTFENSICNETMELSSSSGNIINENNTFINASIGYEYNIQTDNNTIYQVGDNIEFNINITKINLPFSYISNYTRGDIESENKFNQDLENLINQQIAENSYDVYLNDEYIKTTNKGETSFTITTDVPNISTVYVMKSSHNIFNKTSNIISFESELNGLKNTLINVSTEALYTDNATFAITVTDRNNNLVSDCGSVSLYDNNTFLGESETINGIAIITTDKLSNDYHNITVYYNDSTGKYNNQSMIYTAHVGVKKIYIASNVTEAGLGTLENPTTIIDALKRIGNNGTIYFLPGTYNFNEALTTGHINETIIAYGARKVEGFVHPSVKSLSLEGINETFITSTDEDVVLIASRATIINLKFINNPARQTLRGGNAINCSFINCSLGIQNGNAINCLFENNTCGISGGRNLTAINCTFINNHNDGQKGGAIAVGETDQPWIVTSINNTFINNSANYGGAISSPGLISINDTFINNSAPIGGTIYTKYHYLITQLYVYNGTFINSTAKTMGGAIHGQVTNISIINSTFENINSPQETINIVGIGHNGDHSHTWIMENNTYHNCSMQFRKFTLDSPQNNTTLTPYDSITLNMNVTLSNPIFYDEDVLEKTTYPIIINEKYEYNITNNLTIPAEYDMQTEVLNIYASTPDKQTNNIHIEFMKAEIKVDPITAIIGETINITARITMGTETMTNINKGKVTFKVNGKTLKDANGKVIYAKVVNGTATISDYLVPDTWNENTTIQAIYSGSSQCEKLTSEKTTITINQSTPTVPTLTTSNITASTGSTITLTATITDGAKQINNGKIVFKINGKTVKDANGKVIYAKVVNGQVSVEYTLPIEMKANEYNITATYISNDYRLEDNKILTVKK